MSLWRSAWLDGSTKTMSNQYIANTLDAPIANLGPIALISHRQNAEHVLLALFVKEEATFQSQKVIGAPTLHQPQSIYVSTKTLARIYKFINCLEVVLMLYVLKVTQEYYVRSV